MSLASLILSLLGDIQDPRVRSEIAATVYFLRDVYMHGRMGEEELYEELCGVISTVLDVTHPFLLPDEKKKKVDEMAKQMVRAIKIETVRARLMRKMSRLPGAPF